MAQQNEKKINVTEDDIIDFTLQYLYNNLSKNEVHFENEIIASIKLNLNKMQLEQLRELILNTNLVQASIGFGKVGNMYLNASGIAIMKRYTTYKNYLALTPQTPLNVLPINNLTPKPNKIKKPKIEKDDYLNTVGEDD